jgi:KDO2-lipid IV(A) lauroyltransferase
MVAQFGLHLPDFMMVTKKLKPGWLHDRMQQGRSSCRVRATYEPKTLRDVLSQLKAGETVGIALDQYAGPPVGVRVPFLGACVGTHTLIALLVKRTGAAVVPVRCFREENGIYQVEFLPEVEWVEHENVHEENALNTARYAASMESMVRGHPRQWLWTHRRFKGDLSPLRPGEWGQGRVRK